MGQRARAPPLLLLGHLRSGRNHSKAVPAKAPRCCAEPYDSIFARFGAGCSMAPPSRSAQRTARSSMLMPVMASPMSSDTSAKTWGLLKCVTALTMARARLSGVLGLEDAAADEDAVHAQLHAQRGIGGRRNATRREVHDRQLALLLHLLQERQRRSHLLREGEQLVVVHRLQHADLLMQGPDVAHGLDDVARACLALRADHAGALGDA
eukprot:CAMPEP_0176272130 /NCGR_PEP_ID=MMETSP0121_2-20121125/45556_1 /TAXON_ID=160619 /ORGANISM="Kryptoperidinium foliaceum, Strain CCMP 1326" /LENGTH=208 /DNA_ID=CAMNT_0017612295 /DNA_START=235 /DNA_END=856 /DNA_ORIENTATION=+